MGTIDFLFARKNWQVRVLTPGSPTIVNKLSRREAQQMARDLIVPRVAGHSIIVEKMPKGA